MGNKFSTGLIKLFLLPPIPGFYVGISRIDQDEQLKKIHSSRLRKPKFPTHLSNNTRRRNPRITITTGRPRLRLILQVGNDLIEMPLGQTPERIKITAPVVHSIPVIFHTTNVTSEWKSGEMLCHSFIGGGFQHGELVGQERTHFPGLRLISKTLRRQIDS